MTTTKIILTEELRKEILQSINYFDNQLKKEMVFSADLRKHERIITYTKKIAELQNSLVLGWI
jgi:hypothetical protein